MASDAPKLPAAMEKLLEKWNHESERCDNLDCDEPRHEQCGHPTSACFRCALEAASPQIIAQVLLEEAKAMRDELAGCLNLTMARRVADLRIAALEAAAIPLKGESHERTE